MRIGGRDMEKNWLAPVVLESSHARLLPLALEHHEQLQDAIADGELWKLWYTAVPSPAELQADIVKRLTRQAEYSCLPFTVVDPASGRVVGMTHFLNVDSDHRRVEIGGTWYRKDVQRTSLNTACKLLLLTHAFETLDCIAVEFRTHFFNQDSRKAIERLGAKLDGVMRNHSRAKNGTLRDTCVYSLLPHEWPTVKAHLEFQLARPR